MSELTDITSFLNCTSVLIMLKGHRTEVRLTPHMKRISQALYTVEVMRQILGETCKLTEKAIPRHRRSHTLASWWCAGDVGEATEEHPFGCVSPGFIQKVPGSCNGSSTAEARHRGGCLWGVFLSWVSSALNKEGLAY